MALSISANPLSTVGIRAFAPRSGDGSASNPVDAFQSGSANQTWQMMAQLRSLASQRGDVRGHGMVTVDPTSVAVGQKDARAHENDPIDWANPAKSLKHLSQIDSDLGPQQGGNDQDRCGAAALVGGTMLMGAEKLRAAAKVLAQKAVELLKACGADPLAIDLQRAVADLTVISALPKEKLTIGHMHRMQQAAYVVINLEQNLMGGGKGSGLATVPMAVWRNQLWGGDRPRIQGKEMDIYIVDTPGGGHHYVLGEKGGRQELGYNPWPQADGSAYVLGRGRGTTIGQGGGLSGEPI